MKKEKENKSKWLIQLIDDSIVLQVVENELAPDMIIVKSKEMYKHLGGDISIY